MILLRRVGFAVFAWAFATLVFGAIASFVAPPVPGDPWWFPWAFTGTWLAAGPVTLGIVVWALSKGGLLP